LKLELAEAKVSKANGVGGAGNDVRYWKQKYETLLLAVDK
jgi:hypothetical protein